uniref:Uncharacterized protein n=1 Tax=Branchiostoma floridae TaxID=7739 RepID=C3YEY8_BRAFL|eukprot:XP_002605222.1 hypothetical protein BRAFLDRAFT_92309 [Branchiostoma floridae]
MHNTTETESSVKCHVWGFLSNMAVGMTPHLVAVLARINLAARTSPARHQNCLERNARLEIRRYLQICFCETQQFLTRGDPNVRNDLRKKTNASPGDTVQSNSMCFEGFKKIFRTQQLRQGHPSAEFEDDSIEEVIESEGKETDDAQPSPNLSLPNIDGIPDDDAS